MPNWTDAEESFMKRAIEIAWQGRGKTSPNPMVGCVLVQDGEIIAEGWHDHLGALHAEQMAIHNAEENGKSTNGATAYVTLEPCNHFGRTPPCTESLLWAGINKVVIACGDPNPNVRGSGIKVLQEAGVEVQFGLLETEAAQQMRGFLHWCEHRQPFVVVKLAVDKHGSVDDLSENAQRFTSEECLNKVHDFRKDFDAILVGANTVLRDDPQLTIRRVETTRQPLRIVIDPNSKIPATSRVLNDGFETLHLTDEFNGLKSMMNKLGDKEIQMLLVEGGPETIQRFLNAGLVSIFYLVKSSSVHQKPVPSGIDETKLRNSGFDLLKTEFWGDEEVWIFSKVA